MYVDVKHGFMTEKQIERVRVKITRVEALFSVEPFLPFSAAYLNVQQRIKEEPDITRRNLLREERRAMLEGVGLIYG